MFIFFQSTSIVEDYSIDWSKKLGTGVNGPVYTCNDRSTRISYALKILKDSSQGHREVELHYRCKSHPHIVNIQDVYANSIQFPGDSHASNALCVVMELMQGGELFDRISKAEKFTERNAARFTKQVRRHRIRDKLKAEETTVMDGIDYFLSASLVH